jgi:hypothetical protein
LVVLLLQTNGAHLQYILWCAIGKRKKDSMLKPIVFFLLWKASSWSGPGFQQHFDLFQRHTPFCTRGSKRLVCSWEIHNRILLQIPQNFKALPGLNPNLVLRLLNSPIWWSACKISQTQTRLLSVIFVWVSCEIYRYQTTDCCELSLHCKD